jgi:hypothetical protein
LLIEKIPEVMLVEDNTSVSLHVSGGVKLTNNGTMRMKTKLYSSSGSAPSQALILKKQYLNLFDAKKISAPK